MSAAGEEELELAPESEPAPGLAQAPVQALRLD